MLSRLVLNLPLHVILLLLVCLFVGFFTICFNIDDMLSSMDGLDITFGFFVLGFTVRPVSLDVLPIEFWHGDDFLDFQATISS